jgi:hypothetical protein
VLFLYCIHVGGLARKFRSYQDQNGQPYLPFLGYLQNIARQKTLKLANSSPTRQRMSAVVCRDKVVRIFHGFITICQSKCARKDFVYYGICTPTTKPKGLTTMSTHKLPYSAPRLKKIGNLTVMTAAYPSINPECYPGGFNTPNTCKK